MPTLKKSHTYRASRYGILLPLKTNNLIMQSNETGLRKHSTIKVKVPVPIKYHAMNTYTGVEIKVPHILNRRITYTSIQPQAPLLQLLYPSQIENEAGYGPMAHDRKRENCLSLPGIEPVPWSSSPQTRHFTDWATPDPHLDCVTSVTLKTVKLRKHTLSCHSIHHTSQVRLLWIKSPQDFIDISQHLTALLKTQLSNKPWHL